MANKNVDYTLRVFCEHIDRPEEEGVEPRTVTVIAHVVQPPPDPTKKRIGWMEWLELEGDHSRALQTFFGEARRLGRSTTTHAPEDMVPGMDTGQRWRFECEDCNETLPVRHDKLLPLLEGLQRHGVSEVSLAALGARFR